jgi:predicted O-linked N-acetylglucosamine transferase (SPINDLY family)
LPGGLSVLVCSHLLDLHDHRRFAVTLLLTAAAQPPSDGVSQQQSSARAIRYSVRDMRAASSAAIAACVNELGVHILVDMNGLTDGSRLGALSLLPAPVRMASVSWRRALATTALDRASSAITTADGAWVRSQCSHAQIRAALRRLST